MDKSRFAHAPSLRLVYQLFPFFIGFEPGLRVAVFGEAVPKVCPNISADACFPDLFKLFRPIIPVSFDSFTSFTQKRKVPFLIDSLTTQIRLKGTLICDDQSGLLLFFGSPWFTDIAQLQNSPLTLSDFTIHDSILDFLFVVKAKTLALQDAERCSATIAQQRDDLAQTNRELARASAAKSQFLANTSHELRTPLNGIIGMATLLTRLPLAKLERNYAGKILRSAEALLSVVNDVLDLAKIEADKLTLEQIPFDLYAIAYEVAELFAVSAQAKGLELVCVIDGDLPATVLGDPGRLRQVLSNLTGNAVKFTSQGEVVLRVSLLPGSAEDVRVRFQVSDTGIGIDPAHRDKVFSAFSQIDDSMSRKYGGTGLGLALCRQLVELMGGDIGFDSQLGQGSQFFFTVSFASAPQQRQGAQVPPSLAARLGQARFLVVDDNATSREMLCGMLCRWGAQAQAAESAQTGLLHLRAALAAGTPFDFVLIDAVMPGLSGVDLALILTGDPDFDGLRTVLLTSVNEESADCLSNKRARLSASLVKPVRASHLLDCLSDLLSRPVAPLASAGGSATPSAAEAPPEEAPRRPGRLLLVEDHPVNQEVAARMVAVLGYEADIAADGQEGVEAWACGGYALVLMDLQMPRLDGYAATAEIRRREGAGQRTPIVAMTAHAMGPDRVRALAAGMDDYLAKPVSLDQLGALLERWVPIGLRQAPIDLTTLDSLRRYQQPGKPDLVASLIGMFVRDLPDRQQTMQAAAAQGDLGTIASAAHALKSSSLSLGARRLSDICEQLEARCKVAAVVDEIAGLHADFAAECKRVCSALARIPGAAPAGAEQAGAAAAGQDPVMISMA